MGTKFPACFWAKKKPRGCYHAAFENLKRNVLIVCAGHFQFLDACFFTNKST